MRHSLSHRAALRHWVAGHARPRGRRTAAAVSAHERARTSRSPARRAMRLALTATTAAAGLAVVLGMTVLIVALGNASSGTYPPANLVMPSHQHASGGTGLTIGAVLATYSGAGSAQSVGITVQAPGTWGVAWSFACVGGTREHFRIRDARGRVLVDRLGRYGHGTAWDRNDPGRHHLRINSDCPWDASIVRPAKDDGSAPPGTNPGRAHAGRPAHSPGPDHNPGGSGGHDGGSGNKGANGGLGGSNGHKGTRGSQGNGHQGANGSRGGTNSNQGGNSRQRASGSRNAGTRQNPSPSPTPNPAGSSGPGQSKTGGASRLRFSS